MKPGNVSCVHHVRDNAIQSMGEKILIIITATLVNLIQNVFAPGGRGGTPLYGLNGDVRSDRVWFAGCFLLNGVFLSLL